MRAPKKGAGDQRGSRQYGDGRKAVLALKDEISAWVESGAPLTIFFRENAERLGGVSYTQLTRHVRRYILKNLTPGRSDDDERAAAGSTPSPSPASGPPQVRLGEPRRFEHRATNDDDDII